MADKRKIVIDLNNSLYAHGFESEQQIHKEDLDKTISIIRNQLQQTDMQEDQNVFLTHLYRTIGIFGDRGSGKTSFMISLLNQCKNELKDDVEVLRMIDPTLVEHKKPIILCVISMIQQKVEAVLRLKECSTTDTYELKRNALAVGAVVPFCRCVFLYRGTPSFPRCRGPPDQSEFLAIQTDRR